MPAIRCHCGNVIQVENSDAGRNIVCGCGSEWTIPSLSELTRSDEPIDMRWRTSDTHDADTVSEEEDREFAMMLTTIQDRVSKEALSNYLSACDRAVGRWANDMGERHGFDVQIAAAIAPNGRRLVNIQADPKHRLAYQLDLLEETIRKLQPPPVVLGPVAFMFRRRIGEGAPDPPSFRFPFQQELDGDGYLDEMLLIATGGARDGSLKTFREYMQPPRPKRSIWDWFMSLSRWFDALMYGNDQSPYRQIRPAHESHSTRDPQSLSPEDVDELDYVEVLLQQERYDSVVAECTARLRQAPDDDRAYYLRGLANTASGSLEQGLVDLSDAIRRNADDAVYFASRAEIYYELGAMEEAESDLSRAIELDDREPGFLVRRAHCRLFQRRLEDAMLDVEAACQLDPHNEAAFVVRGLLNLDAEHSTVQRAESAVSDFSAALAISPNNPIHLAHRARAYVSQGKYELAVADCDQAISVDDQCGMAFGVRGYAEQQLERYDDVIPDCSKAIDLGFRSATIYVARAIAYHAMGETDLAVDDCDAALAEEPDSAVALNYRGVLRISQGDIDGAMSDFAEAGRIAPEWAMPRGLLANTHRLQSDYEKAIQDYTAAIDLDPTDIAARVNRALCWIDMDQYDNAMEDLNESLAQDPELAAAYVYRAQLYLHHEQPDKALADLNQAISFQQDDVDAIHLRAQLHQSEGRMEEAMKDYNRLVELSPDSPNAFLGRANAWIELGRDDKVADDYEQAKQLDPEAADALTLHRLLSEAQVLNQKEDYAGSIERASEALEHDPDCELAYAIRAASRWYSEDWVEAVDDYNHLLSEEPNNRWFLSARGQVLAEMGEFNAAQSDLRQALAKPDSEEDEDDKPDGSSRAYTLNGMGLTMIGLGKLDEAEQVLNESLRLQPDNAWAHYNRGLLLRERGEIADAIASFRRALDSQKPPLNSRKRERASAFLREHEES